jgi:hypothetical protein
MEPRQKTAKGREIPVPARGEFYRDLERRVKAKPEKKPKRDGANTGVARRNTPSASRLSHVPCSATLAARSGGLFR